MFPFISAPMFYAAICALVGMLCLGAEIHGHSRGVDDTEQRYAAARAEQEHEARMFEQARATKLQEIEDAKTTELRGVSDRLASALDELRKRSEVRLSGPAATACAGATGAELAGPDGRFLARYGAFARSIQLELGACQERERAGSRP